MDRLHQGIDRTAESALIHFPTIPGSSGKHAGTKMNGLRPLGFKNFAKLFNIITRAAASKDTGWQSLIISGKSFGCCRQAIETTG